MQNKKLDKLFEQYYNENIEFLRRYCNFRLGDYPDYADDCIQEAFRVLYEKLSKDIEFKHVRGFLIKAASNFIKSKYRDIDRERYRENSIDFNMIDISFEEELFSTDEENIQNLKFDIISSLSKKEKQLLERICNNYEKSHKSNKELAKEFNCSEVNIRHKIFILKRKIKRLVKEKTKNL